MTRREENNQAHPSGSIPATAGPTLLSEIINTHGRPLPPFMGPDRPVVTWLLEPFLTISGVLDTPLLHIALRSCQLHVLKLMLCAFRF